FFLDNQYIWWHSGNAQPEGQVALNFGRVRDPVLDQLLDDAHTNPDVAAGKKDAEDVNREFAKQCWLIPQWWVAWGIVSKPAVQGIGAATFPGGTGKLYDGQSFPGQIWWQNVYVKQ